jgi:galactokinase
MLPTRTLPAGLCALASGDGPESGTGKESRVALTRRATGPGRVNLIGDHTDYNSGLALPMAIGPGVTVAFTASTSRRITVTSSLFDRAAELDVDLDPDPSAVSAVEPAWARPIAALIALVGPAHGGTAAITTTLPLGSGLSSSAALGVAMAEVLGTEGTPEEIARLCQNAEQLAGVPVGLMDPLVCAGGRAGHAMLIDFSVLSYRHVAVPMDVDIVVVDSGQSRDLRASAYARRVAECEQAAARIGPLGRAHLGDLDDLDDPVLRQRARHVVTECRRVRDTADALVTGDLALVGRLLSESHRSLAEDFAVSTPVLDDLVADLVTRPGVLGARLTGAGFGGCVVALAQPGTLDPDGLSRPAWLVRASDGTVASRR